MTKKLILSTLVSVVILFVWTAVSQMLPWGVPTVQRIATQSLAQAADLPQKPIELPANSLTTAQFDEQFANKISALATDKTYSFIISKPIATNDVKSHFMKEMISQLLVSLFLSVLVLLTTELSNQKRLLIIITCGLLAGAGIYGNLMNWWGVPTSYGLGVSFNLIVGWLLAFFVSSRYIFKKINILE